MDDKLTTKDAITVLRNLQDWLYFSSMNGGTPIQREAIDIAIGALKQPEIVRCKDCKYGEQDEVGRWFCISLGCQIGNEDGSGYCADAERRTDE